jgi:tRNA(adenine34) deaminase
MEKHREFMKMALQQAALAASLGEIPVGAVLVRNNEVIAKAHNLTEINKNVTHHAEILLINEFSKTNHEKYLTDCTLYVTLEPCIMCTGALIWAKLPTLVFGAMDKKVGACGTVLNLASTSKTNHSIHVIHGIMELECEKMLTSFFERLR